MRAASTTSWLASVPSFEPLLPLPPRRYDRSASAWLASIGHIVPSRRVFQVTDQLGSV
jgi:hypothetical protein